MATRTDVWPGVERWAQGLGRLRDVVRQEIVARQLGELIAERPMRRRLRVVDVGCGQGTQALRLADAGHEVTGLDPSEALLDRFAGELSRRQPEIRARVHLVRGLGEAAPELTQGAV